MENNNSSKKLIHSKKFNIRWGEMDAYGHLNNTTYFFYTQEARFEMLTENGIKIDIHGIAPILAQTSCKFIRPVVYPESLVIDSYLVNVAGKKVIFEHVISSATKPGMVYAISDSVVVWYDFVNSQSVEVPDSVRATFEK